MKGYRTFVISGIAVLIAAFSAATGVLTTDPKAQASVVIMAAIMAALRVVTTTAPGKGG